MGKGNRNRQERTEDMTLNPQKYVQKKKSNSGAKVGAIIAVVIALLLVVVIAVNLVASSGLLLRMSTAAESDDYEVDGAMMSYLVHAAFSNHYSYMMQIAEAYGIDVSYLLTYDTSVSLKAQYQDQATGTTWFDYFADTAKQQAETMLVYCQAAKAAGVALDAEEVDAIDASIKSLEEGILAYVEQATAAGMTVSYDSYMRQNYGEGVKMSDIRKVMELQQLAAKYEGMIREEKLAAITDGDVASYYESNKLTYQVADYISYKFEAKKGTTDDAADVYAADKADIDAIVETLKGAASQEEFEQLLKDYLTEKFTAEYTETNYASYLADAEGATDEEKEAAAKAKLEEEVAKAVEKDMEALATTGKTYTADEELSTWIFGGEEGTPAADGATKAITNDDETAGTYTVTVYMVTAAAHRSAETTRTFTYLTFDKALGHTVSDAESVAAIMKDKADPAAYLEEMANSEQYAGKASFGNYEEVVRGEVGVDKLDEWMYADGRAAGDYTVLTDTTTDGAEYYIVIYLDAIGNEEWYVNCREALLDEQMTEWDDEMTKEYTVKFNSDMLDKIKM